MRKLLLLVPAALILTACESVGLHAENTGNAVYDALVAAGEDPEIARAVAESIKQAILDSSQGTGFLDILRGVGDVALTLILGYFGVKKGGPILTKPFRKQPES